MASFSSQLGLSLSLLIQKRWSWALAGAGLSGAWILLLSQWLYPLFRNGEGPKAAGRMFAHLGDSFGEILFTLISRPWLAFTQIDLGGGAFYLLLLILPALPFWRRRSLVILSAAIAPSARQPQRRGSVLSHADSPLQPSSCRAQRDCRYRWISPTAKEGLPLERCDLGSDSAGLHWQSPGFLLVPISIE